MIVEMWTIKVTKNIKPTNNCTSILGLRDSSPKMKILPFIHAGNQTDASRLPYYEGKKTVCLPTFFRLSSFVFNRIKKLIHVRNNLRVSI